MSRMRPNTSSAVATLFQGRSSKHWQASWTATRVLYSSAAAGAPHKCPTFICPINVSRSSIFVATWPHAKYYSDSHSHRYASRSCTRSRIGECASWQSRLGGAVDPCCEQWGCHRQPGNERRGRRGAQQLCVADLARRPGAQRAPCISNRVRDPSYSQTRHDSLSNAARCSLL